MNTLRSMLLFTLAIVFCLHGGCDYPEPTRIKSQKRVPREGPALVLVIGEMTELIDEKLASDDIKVTFDEADREQADWIVVGQDVNRGPMQPHREIYSSLKISELKRLIWLTTGTTKTTDQELLELEMMEVEEGFKDNNVPHRGILFAYDSIHATIQGNNLIKGWDNIREYILTEEE